MELKRKILVVDDCDTNLAIMKTILGDDYLLKLALSGEEAMMIAEAFQPDLILLDIMMPGIDGYEVCRWMRTDTTLRKSKIIMVSAKAMLSERMEGYAAGADDYLTKPFEKDELKAKVRVFMRMKSVEEVEILKSDMLTQFNRELSNRLHGIMLPTTILKTDNGLTATERRMLADIVYHNAKHLQDLLEEIAIAQQQEKEEAQAAR